MPAYGAEWRTDSLFCLVFVLIGLTFSAREVEGKYLFRRRDHNSNQSSSNEAAPEIECRVFKETILHSNQFGSWDEENFACYPIVNGIESDQDYKISLPTTIKDAYRKDIEAGDFFITFRNAKLEGDEVIGDPNDYLIEAHNSTHTSKNRFLQQVGTRSILVLRVSVRDSEPAFTGGQFHDRIFGYDSLSVQSQYSKCSAGKLNFEPARIGNGILEVRLPDRVIKDFSSPTALSNAAQLAAAELLNLSGDQHISSLADHVMICLPPGIEDDKWVAAAAMNHWRSVYNNRFCGIISVTMHELGHNLGLNHANENGDYLDYTSYMSAGHYEEGYPRKCFNGQNHHHLGWFADKTLNLFWSSVDWPVVVNLASFVDYPFLSRRSDEYVLIAIDEKYFLQYNLAKDFNIETEERANQITIVEDMGGGTELLGGVDLDNPIFKIRSRNPNDRSTLFVTVCESNPGARRGLADTMMVTITKDSSFCPTQPTGLPTATPTASQSSLPSFKPTASPSIEPSGTPSIKPSAAASIPPSISSSPSHAPTKYPTIRPSYKPTESPSETPTFKPTESPSLGTSDIPSSKPSVAASFPPSLSSSPSNTPSLIQSADPSAGASTSPSSLPSASPSDSPSFSESLSSAPSQPSSSQPPISSLTPSSGGPSSRPSTHPSPQPSFAPTLKESQSPNSSPSLSQSEFPSVSKLPTQAPTRSSRPSAQSSSFPSETTSLAPSSRPRTEKTSTFPSRAPSLSSMPTRIESESPTISPSMQPSSQPSILPTRVPEAPSIEPSSSFQSSPEPSSPPSVMRSVWPTTFPTKAPTVLPSPFPTLAPAIMLSEMPTLSSSPPVQPSSRPSEITFSLGGHNGHDESIKVLNQQNRDEPEHLLYGTGDLDSVEATSKISLQQQESAGDWKNATTQTNTDNIFEKKPSGSYVSIEERLFGNKPETNKVSLLSNRQQVSQKESTQQNRIKRDPKKYRPPRS